MSGFIYVLRDPQTKAIRYVGQTTNKLTNRLRAHIASAKRGAKWHNANWIRELLSNDLRPIIELVEETETDKLNIREEYWIEHYRKDGCVLTNYGIGGGSHRKYETPIGSNMYRYLKEYKLRKEIEARSVKP